MEYPPYSKLNEVMKKAVEERIRAVLVVPDWRSESWWQEVQQYVVEKYYYRKGTLVFELPDKVVEGTPWGVWAYLVGCREGEDQKKKRRKQDEELMPEGRTMSREEMDGEKRRTTSTARRHRRKFRR